MSLHEECPQQAQLSLSCVSNTAMKVMIIVDRIQQWNYLTNLLDIMKALAAQTRKYSCRYVCFGERADNVETLYASTSKFDMINGDELQLNNGRLYTSK